MTEQQLAQVLPTSHPRLPRGVRLVHNEAQGGWILLAPERVFKADTISVEILKRCTREATVEQIVDDLAKAFAGAPWMSEDVPQDELNRVTKVGEDFGAPYCYQGNLPDPEFGWGHSCSEFTPPVVLTGPHSAGLGLRFYTGNMFPKKYKNAIFLARHGSWNRSKKFGGDIVAIYLNKDGTVKSMEPFITGFLVDNKYIGRPVDVQPMADGSMLISDDWNGAIYRITYGKARTAAN